VSAHAPQPAAVRGPADPGEARRRSITGTSCDRCEDLQLAAAIAAALHRHLCSAIHLRFGSDQLIPAIAEYPLMANDSFALTRSGEDDDDPTASSLIGTQAKMKADAHIYFFTTVPPLGCFHDVGSRDPRGLRYRAIDGTPVTGPFNHQRPTHGSQDR
jgi:hypothetical protein